MLNLEEEKILRISNFALLLVVFNWHHGSERVKDAPVRRVILCSTQQSLYEALRRRCVTPANFNDERNEPVAGRDNSLQKFTMNLSSRDGNYMYNRVDNGKDYDDDENEEALVGYNSLEQFPVNLSWGDGSQDSGDNGNDEDEKEVALVRDTNLEQFRVNLSLGDGSQNSANNGNNCDDDEKEIALVRDNNLEQFSVNLSSGDGSQNDENGDDDREVELGSHSWMDCLVAELYIFSRDDNRTNENYSDDNSCSAH